MAFSIKMCFDLTGCGSFFKGVTYIVMHGNTTVTFTSRPCALKAGNVNSRAYTIAASHWSQSSLSQLTCASEVKYRYGSFVYRNANLHYELNIRHYAILLLDGSVAYSQAGHLPLKGPWKMFKRKSEPPWRPSCPKILQMYVVLNRKEAYFETSMRMPALNVSINQRKRNESCEVVKPPMFSREILSCLHSNVGGIQNFIITAFVVVQGRALTRLS